MVIKYINLVKPIENGSAEFHAHKCCSCYFTACTPFPIVFLCSAYLSNMFRDSQFCISTQIDTPSNLWVEKSVAHATTEGWEIVCSFPLDRLLCSSRFSIDCFQFRSIVLRFSVLIQCSVQLPLYYKMVIWSYSKSFDEQLDRPNSNATIKPVIRWHTRTRNWWHTNYYNKSITSFWHASFKCTS